MYLCVYEDDRCVLLNVKLSAKSTRLLNHPEPPAKSSGIVSCAALPPPRRFLCPANIHTPLRGRAVPAAMPRRGHLPTISPQINPASPRINPANLHTNQPCKVRYGIVAKYGNLTNPQTSTHPLPPPGSLRSPSPPPLALLAVRGNCIRNQSYQPCKPPHNQPCISPLQSTLHITHTARDGLFVPSSPAGHFA